jgi:hypothetical protein
MSSRVAVTTPTRSPSQPDLPTIAESGLPGYDANTRGGILAPAGTPKEVALKLNAEINKALAVDDVRAKLTATGIEIQRGPPERFAAYIKAEVEKWGRSPGRRVSSRNSDGRDGHCANLLWLGRPRGRRAGHRVQDLSRSPMKTRL